MPRSNSHRKLIENCAQINLTRSSFELHNQQSRRRKTRANNIFPRRMNRNKTEEDIYTVNCDLVAKAVHVIGHSIREICRLCWCWFLNESYESRAMSMIRFFKQQTSPGCDLKRKQPPRTTHKVEIFPNKRFSLLLPSARSFSVKYFSLAVWCFLRSGSGISGNYKHFLNH